MRRAKWVRVSLPSLPHGELRQEHQRGALLHNLAIHCTDVLDCCVARGLDDDRRLHGLQLDLRITFTCIACWRHEHPACKPLRSEAVADVYPAHPRALPGWHVGLQLWHMLCAGLTSVSPAFTAWPTFTFTSHTVPAQRRRQEHAGLGAGTDTCTYTWRQAEKATGPHHYSPPLVPSCTLSAPVTAAVTWVPSWPSYGFSSSSPTSKRTAADGCRRKGGAVDRRRSPSGVAKGLCRRCPLRVCIVHDLPPAILQASCGDTACHRPSSTSARQRHNLSAHHGLHLGGIQLLQHLGIQGHLHSRRPWLQLWWHDRLSNTTVHKAAERL